MSENKPNQENILSRGYTNGKALRQLAPGTLDWKRRPEKLEEREDGREGMYLGEDNGYLGILILTLTFTLREGLNDVMM